MRKLIVLIIVFVLLFAGFGLWFFNGLRPVSSDKQTKRFVIDPGEPAAQIGSDLQKNNLVKSAIVFRIYSQVTQAARSIKPGSYDLSSNQSMIQVISKLLAGPTEEWVTIPEGLRREEVAEKFADFEKFDKNQFVKLTQGKEGYLFPDTYLFMRDVSTSTVVKAMEDNFEKKYVEATKKKTSNLSKEQIVVLASIIQREAITPEDMQGVASTLINRFDQGMTLGSDVTVEYALGQQSDGNWWKKDLTADDLVINSAYNTRVNPGFPPAPICNPGLVALQAAANPPQTDYLYYLSDKEGKLHFARTLDEHNANIEKYLQ